MFLPSLNQVVVRSGTSFSGERVQSVCETSVTARYTLHNTLIIITSVNHLKGREGDGGGGRGREKERVLQY